MATTFAKHPGVITSPGATGGTVYARPLSINNQLNLDDQILLQHVKCDVAATTGVLVGEGLKVPIVSGLLWTVTYRPHGSGETTLFHAVDLNTDGQALHALQPTQPTIVATGGGRDPYIDMDNVTGAVTIQGGNGVRVLSLAGPTTATITGGTDGDTLRLYLIPNGGTLAVAGAVFAPTVPATLPLVRIRGAWTLGTFDTTPPTPGTVSASATTSTSFTLSLSGGADLGGLSTQPYRFTVDDGVTWSAWSSVPSIAISGRTPSTAYKCRGHVRDSAGYVATTPTVTVTTAA